MLKETILTWAQEHFSVTAEYLWADSPESAVLRNIATHKWFALFMTIAQNRLGLDGNDPIDILNVKCDPIMVGALRQLRGFYPAYHMNKERWLSIVLDGTVPMEDITPLLELSFQLSEGKKRKPASIGTPASRAEKK